MTVIGVSLKLYFGYRQTLRWCDQVSTVLTDDTAACELIGQPVQLVISSRPNPKVTRPEDLPYIELLLKQALSGA